MTRRVAKKAIQPQTIKPAGAKPVGANPAGSKTTAVSAGAPAVTTTGKHLRGKARVFGSKVVYQGRVFSVTQDNVEEPGGVVATRDVVRHNGSVVVLAVEDTRNPADPDILVIRQYRHAAGHFLWELPAGRIEPGEKVIASGKRELAEETGYRARKWSVHTKYFASPGFVGETMTILLARDLTAGIATPEEDEKIEVRMTPLSELLRLIRAGSILDGKTQIGVLLLEHLRSH
jgi:ADP-ribose pyrophosphatase